MMVRSQLVDPQDLDNYRIARVGCKDPHGLPLNPFRTRIWMEPDGTWSASYRKGDDSWEVAGCDSQVEASVDLRHFVRSKVVHMPDGTFVEVVRR